uniref:Oxysterol-binding protein n=1 Tax=Ciona savignyi TaxID=51511 RepID=H2YR77_CIOSA
PEKYEGYMLKKKKWPLKGWHKRFFVLAEGFLKYAKTPHAISKEKVHGVMDMGLSVMSTKKNALTIDLDAADVIFHLKVFCGNAKIKFDNGSIRIMHGSKNAHYISIKVKSPTIYQLWISRMRCHRDFRQQILKRDSTLNFRSFNTSIDANRNTSIDAKKQTAKMATVESSSAISSLSDVGQLQSDNFKVISFVFSHLHEVNNVSPASRAFHAQYEPKQPRPECCGTDLHIHRKHGAEFSKNILPSFKPLNVTNQLTTDYSPQDACEGFGKLHAVVGKPPKPSNAAKYHYKGFTKTQYLASTFFVHSSTLTITMEKNELQARLKRIHQESADTPLRTSRINEVDFTKVFFLFSFTDETILSLWFIETVKVFILISVYDSKPVTLLYSTLISYEYCQRGLVRGLTHQSNISTWCHTATIHRSTNAMQPHQRPMLGKLLSESQLSISDTADLFYDAEEYFLSDEESSSDEEVWFSDGDDVSSETELSDTEAPGKLHRFIGLSCFSLWYVAGVRRSRLPCPAPVSDVSLWNILKKNIGKDLSKVAMPVTLNEPLNALQLLCEELEYSELLDDAARSDDKFERMLLVATFAVSGYCSTYHRAGQKPFNPILGETYEHIRDNKNLRFVAEQVSHHPPISACHCTGEGFEYWRDVRFKNKFWGKSMEVFPVGSVHVKLKGCEYEWKKVTSCVHNIVAGTRWVEHYGDMLISSEDVICKISFSKSGYWSSKHGEISGAVMNAQGEVVHKLHGKWFEGVFCETAGHTRCLWRAESMPPDFEQYYGFSKFAIELNELTNLDRKYLPHTDTRHRPDQRLLELGDVDSAEAEKQRVEQIQRDHKRLRDENNIDYHPRFFKKVLVGASERWQYTGNYWQARKDPGFQEFLQDITPLW